MQVFVQIFYVSKTITVIVEKRKLVYLSVPINYSQQQ